MGGVVKLKHSRFPYDGKRTNNCIRVADAVICTAIILAFVFQKPLGISRFIQRRLGIAESWAEFIVGLCAIFLSVVEQFVSYHIDRRMGK